eukprot:1141553-Amphidinium_carterae.1
MCPMQGRCSNVHSVLFNLKHLNLSPFTTTCFQNCAVNWGSVQMFNPAGDSLDTSPPWARTGMNI